MADDVKAPLLKNPKFLITAGVIVVASLFLGTAVIDPALWASVVEFVAGAFLGAPGVH